MLKASQVRDKIREHGVERGTVGCLEVLAEQCIALEKQNQELAMQLLALAKMFQTYVDGVDHIIEAAERAKKLTKTPDGDDGSDPTTPPTH